MKNTHSLFLCALVALTGCGDCDGGDSPEGGGPEGGAPVGGDGGGPTVDLEKPDAGINDCHADFMEDGVCRPSLSKCAPGTIPDIDEGCVAVGVPSCAPEFVDERGICLPAVDACEPGTFPVPSLGCVPIDGDAGCGTGKWGAIVEAAGDIHVDQSYTLDDSDGTREKPFANILAATSATADGDRIVIAEGTYPVGIAFDRPINLEGICASKVTLTTEEGDPGVLGYFMQKGDVASLKGVALQAPAQSVVVAGGHVDIERVHIHDVDFGVYVVDGGVATVTRTLIEDINQSSGTGYGILAQDGGQIEVSETAVIHARSAGIGIYDGGTLVATDIFVGSMLPDATGYAEAADTQSGGEMTIERSVFARTSMGITVYGAGSLTIHDSVVAETSDTTYGELLAVVDSPGFLEASGNVLVDGSGAGIGMYAGEIHSSHNWISDLGGGSFGSSGIIQLVQAPGGVLTSEKDVITNVEQAGIWTTLPATIDGAVIEGVAYVEANGLAFGSGILAGNGGGTIERSFVSGASDYGIYAVGLVEEPAKLVISRSRVEATAGVDGAQGVGIAGGAGIELSIKNTAIENVRGAGILLSGIPANLSSTMVSGVVAAPITAAFPIEGLSSSMSVGLLFHDGAESTGVTLTDCWFEGYEDVGLVFSEAGHELTRVRATGGKLGLALEDEATAEQTDCDFSGNSAAEQAEDAGAALPP